MMMSWCLALSLLPRAQAADAEAEARALVAKGLDAQGGLAVLGRNIAARGKMRGSFADGTAQFSGEFHSQRGGKFRLALQFKDEGSRLLILNDAKGWLQFDGITQELDDEMLARLKRARHVDRVCGLVTLVRDKGYTLKPLGEATVDSAAALGVKVGFDGQPDVDLYFDKKSGLLVKSAYRAAAAADGEQVSHEMHYRDYRLVDVTAADEERLRNAKRGSAAQDLLATLRTSIPADADRGRIEALIKQLGDPSFAVRQKASSGLGEYGIKAAALLQRARKMADLEAGRRAATCLERLAPDIALAASTVRLLGARKPPGAAPALLAYLPWAPDEAVAREVEDALTAIAEASKTPDPALVDALTAPDARVREAARAALGKDGGAALRRPGRRVYLEGLRLANRSISYQDGQKRMELETVEREFFNRHDENLFTRPDQDSAPPSPQEKQRTIEGAR
jgi:hypothetical protein